MKSWIEISIAVVVPFATMAITKPSREDVESTWYVNLKRPTVYPPRWLFGPLWLTVNVTVGYASYLVWRDGGDDAMSALMPYAGSLLTIAAWPPIVFRTRNLALATIDCIAWSALAVMYHRFFAAINPTAGQLSMVSLIWAFYSNYVSFSLWIADSKK